MTNIVAHFQLIKLILDFKREWMLLWVLLSLFKLEEEHLSVGITHVPLLELLRVALGDHDLPVVEQSEADLDAAVVGVQEQSEHGVGLHGEEMLGLVFLATQHGRTSGLLQSVDTGPESQTLCVLVRFVSDISWLLSSRSIVKIGWHLGWEFVAVVRTLLNDPVSRFTVWICKEWISTFTAKIKTVIIETFLTHAFSLA